DRAMTGTDPHEWPIDLEAAEYAEVLVAPRAVDLAATVLAPSGATGRGVDGLNIVFGVDGEDRIVVSFVAGDAGRYRLRLKPAGRAAAAAPPPHRPRHAP